MSKLYNIMATNMVIGCLYNDPSLYFSEKYRLDLDDFHNPKQNRGYRFQRILFGAGYELAKKGVQEINEIDISEFVSNWKENMEILEDNDYLNAIVSFKELAKKDSFDFYYNRIRTLSLLADLKYEKGYNIDKFFNEDESSEKQFANLEKYSIKDIINYYEISTCDIKQKYYKNENNEYYKAGRDFKETIERIKKHSLMGSSFQSKLLNNILNGQLGFQITAGKSGDGKSIIACGNMCNVSALRVYSPEKKSFIDNPYYAGGSLFINTELDLRTELDVMCIAFISNIDRGKIKRWNLTEEEEQRVLMASDVLENSPIYFVDDAEFDTKSLESEIKDHVLKHNIKHVYFDYIQNNSYVAKEISSEQKITTREDMVLLTLTSRCKDIQNKYGVFFGAGIQCNSQIETLPYPTEHVLAGGASSVRKTDATVVLKQITKEEQEVFDKCYFKKITGFGTELKPNRTCHIVKGRNSAFDKYCKVLLNINFGTGRIVDFMAMDKNNKPINVTELDIITENIE